MARIKEEDREKEKTSTRQKLLDAAVVEFSRLGFDQANINHISETAGLGKGTVYNYFESKKELMLTLIQAVSDLHRACISKQVMETNFPIHRLMVFYAAGFEFVEEYPHEAQFLVTTMFGPNREFREAIYRSYTWMMYLIKSEIIEYGRNRGLFLRVDPEKTTYLVANLYLGTCANVDANGKVYMKPDDVSQFVLRAIQNGDLYSRGKNEDHNDPGQLP